MPDHLPLPQWSHHQEPALATDQCTPSSPSFLPMPCTSLTHEPVPSTTFLGHHHRSPQPESPSLWIALPGESLSLPHLKIGPTQHSSDPAPSPTALTGSKPVPAGPPPAHHGHAAKGNPLFWHGLPAWDLASPLRWVRLEATENWPMCTVVPHNFHLSLFE
jgi:hypothetical protein